MPRKAKKKLHAMPPLSFVDKLIYWTLFSLLLAGCLALLFGTLFLRDIIAFSDPTVVAARDHLSIIWLIVPFLVFFLLTFIPWTNAYQSRKPIFGRRHFKYGPPAWPRVYPLFMKNKPLVRSSARDKKRRKLLVPILLLVLLIGFVPFPWSLYGRDCLRNDGSIVQYNMFNCETDIAASGDIHDIEIYTYRYYSRYLTNVRWCVGMNFKAEGGEKYTFQYNDFRISPATETVYWLARMLQIKAQYSAGRIHYSGAEHLDLVIASWDLNPEEAALLNQLFAQ